MRVEDAPLHIVRRLTQYEVERQALLNAARNAATRANEIRNSLRYRRQEPNAAENEELSVLDAHRDKAQRDHDELHGLVSSLRQWLNSLPAQTKLELAPSPMISLTGNETLIEQVEAIRREITRVGNRLSVVRHAVLPKSEMKQLAKAYAESLARPPTVSFANDAIRCDFLTMQSDAQTAFKDLLHLLAWADASLIWKALHKMIDGLPDLGEAAMSASARIKETNRLADELLSLERREEAMLAIAEREGLSVVRRSEASPQAILGVRIVGRREAAA